MQQDHECVILSEHQQQDKKYAVPLRAIVGKVSADDPESMYPNENFQIYFPDAEIPDELPFAYRSCCLRIGSHVVIQKVMREYDLQTMLAKRFGKETGLILDLASYLIVDEENAGQYYPDFAFSHPLFTDKMTIYSDSKISRLLSSMTKDQFIGFLDDWNENRDHKNRIYVSYDSTNKNCDAGDVDIVEFGKAKLDHAVTKTQKIILSSFGLDEVSVSKIAEDISKRLATSQTFMSKEEMNDGVKEINGIN